MKLSIIIVSWNVEKLLKECLTSLFLQKTSFLFEVIVIDNASSDGSVEMVKRNFPDVTLIENSKNTGFAYANNQGIKISKGTYILLLNPDTYLKKDALEKSIEFMKQHPNCKVMGCKLLNANGSIQKSVRSFPTCVSQTLILLKLHHIFLRFPSLLKYFCLDFDYSKTQSVDQVMGAYFLTSKKIFDEIGLLDDEFFIWFEEVDFCKQVKKKGYDVLYYPFVEVIHYQSQSFIQVMSVKKQKMFNKSLRRYMKKHHNPFCYAWITLISYVSIVLSYFVSLIVKK